MRSIPLAMVAVVGCQSAVDAPAPPTAKPRLSAADRTFRLTPMGIVPGQTNVPPSAAMPFSFAGPLDPSARSLLESQAYVVGPAGQRTGVQVVDLPTQRASDLPSLELQAVKPLATDAWHWLAVEQTAELRVAGAETQQAWKAHFFTGSAPRVVRLLASTVKNPDIVNVTFSEPVNAATLIASTLFVGGGASGKCVLRGAACLNQSQAFLTNNVDLRLDSKFTAANAAVTLPGTVSGIGRSVAAAQGLTGDAYSGGAATLAVLASDWVACGDSTTRCWTDAKVPPASP